MRVRFNSPGVTRSVLAAVAVVALLSLGQFRSAFAHDEPPPQIGGGYTPDTCVQGHNVCGDFEALIPMHGAEGVHAGLVWKDRAATPKILYWARYTDYQGVDVADPDVIRALINAGALRNTVPTNVRNPDGSIFRIGANDFNAAIRGGDFPGGAADTFKRLVYGGFNIIQGLSQSVPTRIIGELNHDRAQLFDISHPDAFKNAEKFDTVRLDDSDFALNAAAFSDAGQSRGLHYNLYCSGHAALSDGRLVMVGGHDMNSNNGLFKVNIFDPNTETWAPRAQPCTQANWRRDPFGAQLFAANPNAKYYPGCNPLDINSTQPKDRSDMKYARWYPTAIALPNDLVLVLGGTDQDATIGPSPAVPLASSDAAFRASKFTRWCRKSMTHVPTGRSRSRTLAESSKSIRRPKSFRPVSDPRTGKCARSVGPLPLSQQTTRSSPASLMRSTMDHTTATRTASTYSARSRTRIEMSRVRTIGPRSRRSVTERITAARPPA